MEANTLTISTITSYYTSYTDTSTDTGTNTDIDIGNEFVSETLGLRLEDPTVDT
jgi:hypothetical protein